jgi:hypothetical protein
MGSVVTHPRGKLRFGRFLVKICQYFPVYLLYLVGNMSRSYCRQRDAEHDV